ncbi:hypothetical protein HYC85_025788 [Camellia sinensis]|uniref:Reverse transcriptase zinc-binding domain-containing protein n=1 Tax=Camellia sinensis TaxID=4442 RepID=A0A7J7GC48_CAMSI|nr:hypothetical protein HYC85_025788 [Camellia sinensis]
MKPLNSVNLECVFCHNDVETVKHILLACPFVWRLWSNIVRWWGFQWVMPGSVDGLLQWWYGCSMSKLEKKIWMVIPMATHWSIWRHRNECVFNGLQLEFEALCDILKVRVALWTKALPLQVAAFVNDLVYNLQQVKFCLRSGG